MCTIISHAVLAPVCNNQNPFLTAQSTQIKSIISVPIKDFIHHYPRALFNDIPRVGAPFYDIPGSGRSLTTYPGQYAINRAVTINFKQAYLMRTFLSKLL